MTTSELTRQFPVILLVVVSMLPASKARGGDKADEFQAESFTAPGLGKMPYRLLEPESYDKSKKYPLVLFLHGWGERGTDNKKQLAQVGSFFLKAESRKKYPCFVVVPQANGSWLQNPTFERPIPLSAKPTANLQMAVDITRAVSKKFSVDPNRVYAMGYSNGACGVYEMLERMPAAWAAAVIMAGAGDPGRITAARRVPIWMFHGAKDPTIPLQRMKEMDAALRAAHATPLYTIYANGVHYDAKRGFGDPALLPWLFAQQRGKPEVSFVEAAGPKAKLPTSLAEK